MRVDFRYPSSSRMIHPLFRLSSSKGKWREISRWDENDTLAGGWAWLTRDDVLSSMLSHSNNYIIAHKLLSCLGHPTKLYSLPRSCFPPILDTDLRYCIFQRHDVLSMSTTYIRDIFLEGCPVYSFTFDYIWLSVSIFFAFAISFLALLCSWCSFTSPRCVTHQVCVNVIICTQKYKILYFFSLSFESYIEINTNIIYLKTNMK